MDKTCLLLKPWRSPVPSLTPLCSAMAICRTSAYSWVDLCAEKFLSFFCLLAKADVLTPPLSSSTEQSYTQHSTLLRTGLVGSTKRASICTLSGYSGRKKEPFSHPPCSSVPGWTALSQNGTTRGPLGIAPLRFFESGSYLCVVIRPAHPHTAC